MIYFFRIQMLLFWPSLDSHRLQSMTRTWEMKQERKLFVTCRYWFCRCHQDECAVQFLFFDSFISGDYHTFRYLLAIYLIPIKIRATLNFASLIFTPLIVAHPQISCLFNLRAPLFYRKFTVFSFIRGTFSSPFNFCAFILRELAPFNFRAG